MQVTVVPRPTAESSVTVPPCSSTKERTSERPRPVPRWREPSEWVSNQSKTLSFTSGGMPGPLSVTENTTASLSRCAAKVTVQAAEERGGFAQRQDCRGSGCEARILSPYSALWDCRLPPDRPV